MKTGIKAISVLSLIGMLYMPVGFAEQQIKEKIGEAKRQWDDEKKIRKDFKNEIIERRNKGQDERIAQKSKLTHEIAAIKAKYQEEIRTLIASSKNADTKKADTRDLKTEMLRNIDSKKSQIESFIQKSREIQKNDVANLEARRDGEISKISRVRKREFLAETHDFRRHLGRDIYRPQ